MVDFLGGQTYLVFRWLTHYPHIIFETMWTPQMSILHNCRLSIRICWCFHRYIMRQYICIEPVAVVIYVKALLMGNADLIHWIIYESVEVKYQTSSQTAALYWWSITAQRAHNAITTLLLRRQNDNATSFWRNNDVIITLCACWEYGEHL